MAGSSGWVEASIDKRSSDMELGEGSVEITDHRGQRRHRVTVESGPWCGLWVPWPARWPRHRGCPGLVSAQRREPRRLREARIRVLGVRLTVKLHVHLPVVSSPRMRSRIGPTRPWRRRDRSRLGLGCPGSTTHSPRQPPSRSAPAGSLYASPTPTARCRRGHQ